MRHGVLITIALGISFDLSSIIGWTHPMIGSMLAGAIAVGIGMVSIRDLRWGIAAILLELFWGSHGRGLVMQVDGAEFSLRMLIFAAVLLATCVHLRHARVRVQILSAFRAHPARWPLAFMIGTVLFAGVVGVFRSPPDQFVRDANAWGFFLLAPTFILAALTEQKLTNGRADSFFIRHSSFAILSGALYLIIRSLVLLFLFSHDLGGLWVGLYQWVRDTRLGEVTVSVVGFPRVFLPSMVLLFLAALLAAWMATDRYGWPRIARILAYVVFGGGVAVLVASLSRSFWLAGAALLALGVVWRALRALPQFATIAHGQPASPRSLHMLGGAAIVGVIVVWGVVRIPYPQPLTTGGLGATLAARIATDAAVSNRWQQLPPLRAAIAEHAIFGNGFGAAVTYESKDPRTLAAFPDGRYTTTAFEWGYLDDMLERGFLGLLAELWLIGALIWHGLRRGGESAVLALGLLAVAIVHATSPYLNHPLGIGVVLMAIVKTTHETDGRSALPYAAK